MNILQINTADTKGGAAKIAYSLKHELEERGHQTSMFVGRKYSSEENIKLLNDIRSFSGKIRKKLAFYLANDIDVFYSDHILKTKEFKNADVVHCHNLHSNYFNLGTLAKISIAKPIIWTFHDMWPITAHCAHSFGGEIKETGFFTCPGPEIYPPIAWHNEKYLEKRKTGVYKRSDFHITTPSKWLADKVGQSILKDNPLSLIYNGINTSVFRPYDQKECRQLLDLPQSKKIVLIVAKGGSSNPWKGVNYAQDVFKSFADDLELYFVKLGGEAGEDKEKIRTVGYINKPEILAKYYSAADMLLYPSIADNCPLVVLEAMACGLPVVSFATGGIPEIIDHKKNGYIAEYKNTSDLIQGVKHISMLEPEEHKNMKTNAIKKINGAFTLEIMADGFINLYKKLLRI